MQIHPINNTNNTNFNGRFIRSGVYYDLTTSTYIDKSLLNSFQKTIRILEKVDDGKVYEIGCCEGIRGSNWHSTYYLTQYNEAGKDSFLDIDPFSKKIIGEVECDSVRVKHNKLISKFNEILRRRYRPHFAYDNAIKEDIYKLMEDGNFENNTAIQDVLNLPYTTRNQLEEFRHNIAELSKVNDGKKFFVSECECLDSGNRYFRLSSVENGEQTSYTDDVFLDNGKNNVLANINSMLKVLWQ